MTEEFQKNKEKAKELRKQLDKIQESLTNVVMIEGVNVAGCINFVGCNMCNDFLDGQCEGHNCEYKQLKRLEQENKELKDNEYSLAKELADLDAELTEVYTETQQLYKTLEDIKEIAMGIMDDDIEETSAYSNALLIINKIDEVNKNGGT